MQMSVRVTMCGYPWILRIVVRWLREVVSPRLSAGEVQLGEVVGRQRRIRRFRDRLPPLAINESRVL